jgi:pyridoxamine 5'-phosphate oxidase
MTDDSHHPDDLGSILKLCWQLLEKGVKDRRHGFHHPVVASVDGAGRPKSRVVILRDASEGALRFHTDVRTPKWSELDARPFVSAVFYDETDRVQLRVEGAAHLHHGDGVAKSTWQSSQRMSKVCYGTVPAPGVVMNSFDAFELPPADDEAAIAIGEANFGAVVIHVHSIEWLYLKARRNRRAFFDLRTNQAKWLVP